VEAAGPTHDARHAEQRRDDEESRRQAKEGKRDEPGIYVSLETKLALPLVIAAEKLLDFVSTPSMDDTDWETA